MVGIGAATTDADSIVTSYRDHCTHLTKGGSLLEVMAELLGRVDGASKGYGGSMHMYRKVGFLRGLRRPRAHAPQGGLWLGDPKQELICMSKAGSIKNPC